MILDCGETLFVWLGRESNRQEREAVLTTAKDYLLSDPSGRDVDIPVILVKQGHEPPHFTGYFGAWDSNLWPVNTESLFVLFLLQDFQWMLETRENAVVVQKDHLKKDGGLRKKGLLFKCIQIEKVLSEVFSPKKAVWILP